MKTPVDRSTVIPIAAEGTHTATEDKCASCKGSLCCTYVTQPIPKPRTKHDFSNLLWQVSHAGVEAFRDDGTWYLLFEGRCSHLQPGGRCGIYETRPEACRDHSNESCERDAPREEGFDLHFKDYDSLLAFCKKKFKHWGKVKKEKNGKKNVR